MMPLQRRGHAPPYLRVQQSLPSVGNGDRRSLDGFSFPPLEGPLLFVFRTLGRVSLEGPNGPVEGRAVQRKRLAVLSVLAAAPDCAASRDAIVGRIWPETTQARSRRLLSDAFYALRKALGDDAILNVGDEEIRLSCEVVRVDLVAFKDALNAGALEEAVEYYQGEFLAGFHLNGSHAFDEWLTAERQRVRDRYAEALQHLAEGAEAAGDLPGAVAWWKRRALETPLDSRVAHRLVSALESAHNPGAALQHARIHEAALREELGLDPPAEFADLVRRIEEGSANSRGSAAAVSGEGPDRPVLTAADRSGNARENPPAAAGRAGAGGPTARRASRWTVGRGALIALVVLVVAWGAASVTAGHDAQPSHPIGVAVLPVDAASMDSAVHLFMTGLRLEVIHGLWTVDGLRVMSWEPGPQWDGSRPTIAEAARQLRASYVLDPVVVPGEGSGALVLQLVEAGTGEVVWSGRYESGLGPSSLTTMPEQVARGTADALSLSRQNPGATHTDPPTENVAAYDAYVRGKALQWRGRVDEWYRAEDLFEQATRLDPDFGEAWAELGEIRSFMLFFHVMDRSVGSARAALERASELAPDAVATHRGHVIMHNNLMDYDAAREHLARMNELEPGNPDVPYLRAMVAMWQGRWEESIRLHKKAAEMNPQATRASFGAALDYLWLGRYEEADRAFDRVLELDPGMPWAATWRVVVPLKRDGDLEEARRRLQQAVDQAGAWPVLYEMSKPKAAELRPFARLLIGDLARLLSDSTRAALRDWCRPCDLRLQALAADRQGDSSRANAYQDSLRVHFDSLAARSDELAVVGPQMWSWLGLELAQTGQAEAAVEAARRATAAIPLSRDAFKATFVAEALAAVYTITGDYEAAVAELDWLLSVPSALTPAVLRLDPMWDPLRSRHDFQELLNRSDRVRPGR